MGSFMHARVLESTRVGQGEGQYLLELGCRHKIGNQRMRRRNLEARDVAGGNVYRSAARNLQAQRPARRIGGHAHVMNHLVEFAPSRHADRAVLSVLEMQYGFSHGEFLPSFGKIETPAQHNVSQTLRTMAKDFSSFSAHSHCRFEDRAHRDGDEREEGHRTHADRHRIRSRTEHAADGLGYGGADE
jgi:hypothetical protein